MERHGTRGWHTKRSRVLLAVSWFSGGVDITGAGADWATTSESSRKGLVDVGRSGRARDGAVAEEGDRARFLKGLLEPRLRADWGEA